MTPETLDELRKKAWAARDELAEAEQKIKDRDNKKLVGKCFVARNCCSCPEGPQDYWPLYGKVLAADAGQVIMFEFQKDKDGRYEIEPHVRRGSLFGGYREIPPEDFNAAWSAVLCELAEINAGN